MFRSALLILAFVFALAPAQAQTQTNRNNNTPPVQSLAPSQSPCGTGSQSVRVCDNDFQSCSSVCTATSLDVNADIAGCSLRCCTQFKACLSIRGCPSRSIDCF
jgi:uncharacterized lipoprotein YajG